MLQCISSTLSLIRRSSTCHEFSNGKMDKSLFDKNQAMNKVENALIFNLSDETSHSHKSIYCI